MKLVINRCFGGFGLSDAAYEKLIEWGIPVRRYVDQDRDPETRRYKPQPLNDGEVIFDRDLDEMTGEGAELKQLTRRACGRFWETWIDKARSHPLLLRVVEELGPKANGSCAALEIIEIPDGVDYEISEYDGNEHVAEKHRTWP